ADERIGEWRSAVRCGADGISENGSVSRSFFDFQAGTDCLCAHLATVRRSEIPLVSIFSS
ncbi:hypothetical protein ACCT32_35035, partial [Rhizobium brockwellii]|uniref:hypothetical protein n=1 Tax=Rhizobium brockwellii TaxID=3019932 RepID=UPI003F9ABF6D